MVGPSLQHCRCRTANATGQIAQVAGQVVPDTCMASRWFFSKLYRLIRGVHWKFSPPALQPISNDV